MNPKIYSCSWAPKEPTEYEKVIKQRKSGPSEAKRRQLRKKR